MTHSDGGVDFAELSVEHSDYIAAAQARMAHRGSLTASAERARAWFTDAHNAWRAQSLLDYFDERQADNIIRSLAKE